MKERYGYFPCSCADPSHYLRIWFDDEQDDWDNVDDDYEHELELCMGFPPMPLRWRVRQIWRLMRSNRWSTWGFVGMSREDAKRLNTVIGRYIAQEQERERRRLERKP